MHCITSCKVLSISNELGTISSPWLKLSCLSRVINMTYERGSVMKNIGENITYSCILIKFCSILNLQ